MIRTLHDLNERQRAVLDQGMALLDRCWDEAAGLTLMTEDGQSFHSSRDTVFYALGLLLRGGPGDLERACRCIRTVLDMQIDAPGEVFDGTFRSTSEQGEPVRGKLDWRRMSLDTRYALDLYHSRLTGTFARRLRDDPALSGLAPQILA